MKKRQKTRQIILLLSFLLFPASFYYFSPYLIVEGAIIGLLSGSGLLFLLLFTSSLILGRAFCGWICPAGRAQDACTMINHKRHKLNWTRGIKLLFWAIWLSVIIVFIFKNGGIQKIDPLWRTSYGLSVASPGAYIIYIPVLTLIITLAIIFGRRSFCHTTCWVAPFMMFGSKISRTIKFPRLRLSANQKNCISCGKCTALCPMSLDVKQMVNEEKMHSYDCILCASCVDSCPTNAIKMGFLNIKK